MYGQGMIHHIKKETNMSAGTIPRRFIFKIVCNNCGINASGKTRLVWMPDASFVLECGNCGEVEKVNLIIEKEEQPKENIEKINPEMLKKKKNGLVN